MTINLNEEAYQFMLAEQADPYIQPFSPCEDYGSPPMLENSMCVDYPDPES